AEISRAQVWQWLRHGAALEDGRRVTPELIGSVIDDEMKTIESELGSQRFQAGRFREARALFERISTAQSLENFLTLPAYEALLRGGRRAAPGNGARRAHDRADGSPQALGPSHQAGIRGGPRRAHRKPGGPAGEGGPPGDLSERLAGRGGRQSLRADLSRPEPL